MSFLTFLVNYRGEILSRTLEHLLLVAAAMLAAVLIGIPLGIALVRRHNLRRWVLGTANVIQTIPSLALFGFLIPVPFLGGIGARTAIVALALLAPLVLLGAGPLSPELGPPGFFKMLVSPIGWVIVRLPWAS